MHIIKVQLFSKLRGKVREKVIQIYTRKWDKRKKKEIEEQGRKEQNILLKNN